MTLGESCVWYYVALLSYTRLRLVGMVATLEPRVCSHKHIPQTNLPGMDLGQKLEKMQHPDSLFCMQEVQVGPHGSLSTT